MYGKAKVSKPDWYMMGICIVFALTFSLRSVPLAVLLLLFMPFSLLSLTGELPLPTRNAPICQTLLCISIPLLVIGAFSSLLLLLPKLLIPSACVWLFGGALMLFLPPGAFRKSRMAMYWAVICFAALVALLIMLLQRYQAYGDLYEGLSYDILRVMMNARTRPQVLYSAYVSGLAALDAKRTAALESLAALTGGNVLPWLSEDVLQQLEWSLRATIEVTLPSVVPDLLVKGIMAFSLGMLLCWRKFPDAEDTPSTDRWFMPTPLGISMAVLLLLSAAQLFTTNATVALAASLLGSVAFWSFAVQGVSAQNFAMIRAGATRGRRWFLTILMVLFVPILPMFAGCFVLAVQKQSTAYNFKSFVCSNWLPNRLHTSKSMLDCFECLLACLATNLNAGFRNRSNHDAVFTCARSFGNLLNECNEIIERTSRQTFCTKENLCVSNQLVHQNQAGATFVEQVLQVLRAGSYAFQIGITNIFCI